MCRKQRSPSGLPRNKKERKNKKICFEEKPVRAFFLEIKVL